MTESTAHLDTDQAGEGTGTGAPPPQPDPIPDASALYAPDPDKLEKFRSAASPRVRRAEETIKLLANMAKSDAYDYGAEQIGKVFDHLEDTVADARRRFTSELADRAAAQTGQGGKDTKSAFAL